MSNHSDAGTLAVQLVDSDPRLSFSDSSTTSPHSIETTEAPTDPAKRELGCDEDILENQVLSDAQESVLESEDILPIILLELKGALLEEPLGHTATDASSPTTGRTLSWKASLCSLLLVNRSFFQAGSNLLWNTMEILEPVFRLLPWYTKTRYNGLGNFQYNGSVDWERFNFYASRIQGFHLISSPEDDFSISSSWLLQLFTLHERPDPLFPILQSIIVTPEAFPGLQVLFLLVGPSLRLLEVFSCSEISDSASIPSDWEAYAGESKEGFREEVQANLIAVLPKVSVSSPQLQSFTYRGPVSMDLFLHISQLKGLVSMNLTMANAYGALLAPYKCLAKLSSLRHLVLEAPLLDALDWWPSPEERVNVDLDTLQVTTTATQQFRLRKSIRFMNLRMLVLEFVGKTSTFLLNSTIKRYLPRSRGLERLSITFLSGKPLGVEEPEDGQSRQQQVEEQQGRPTVVSTLQGSAKLKEVFMRNVPPSLVKSAVYSLQQAMPKWSQLTMLVFQPRQQPISTESQSTLPVAGESTGLSFLGTTVWTRCNNLQELEFHFDEAEIATEDLLNSQAFKSSSRDDDHPLRILRINTTSSRLELDLRKKIEVATFLDRLFPRLDRLQGSASGVWEEVGMLIKSYQAVKEHIYARIEAL
ncbi:hypothetical protein EST38_g7535 [Candolleomyces aberdarensis]|uniref:F-box domain-containing protein n=1 Tax=Candolleomyces aberdarensis TaxID=2316362 RepID=A0A4Q2DF02_9AGAR|nr:hypothetical protein EST38_g7535 [Candolleomyces aberdarensis]